VQGHILSMYCASVHVNPSTNEKFMGAVLIHDRYIADYGRVEVSVQAQRHKEEISKL